MPLLITVLLAAFLLSGAFCLVALGLWIVEIGYDRYRANRMRWPRR